MKTILTFLLFVLFQNTNSWSQNLYVTASCGYNLGTDRSNLKTNTHNYLVGAFYPFSNERFKYSLGKGMDFNVGIGYTMKRNVGFGLEVSYLMGTKTIYKNSYIENDVFQREVWGRFYRISPSVHFICPLEKVSLKMHIGALAGFGKMYLNQENIYNGESEFKYENEFVGGHYLGFKAGIGMVYSINKHLNLSLDLNWANAYFSPIKARVAKFISGGIDKTETLELWQREKIYSNSVTYQPYNPNVPAQGVRENFAASSIGLQVGIQWILWKKVKEKKTDQKAGTNTL